MSRVEFYFSSLGGGVVACIGGSRGVVACIGGSSEELWISFMRLLL